MQEFSPWPFLIIGLILIVTGLVAFVRIRNGIEQEDSQLGTGGKFHDGVDR
jgi:hypothetical protein